MSVRKAHNSGRNHLRNVVEYYQREFGTLVYGILPSKTDIVTSRNRTRESPVGH